MRTPIRPGSRGRAIPGAPHGKAGPPPARSPASAGADSAEPRPHPNPETFPMHVGFVGTGNMGRPMAANVLKAGHSLTVFDLSPAATATLEKASATRATGLQALASSVRVTLMSLPDAKAVEAVMIGASEADVKPFEPIFRAIGKSLFFLGEVGKGNILKLLNNYVALTNQA